MYWTEEGTHPMVLSATMTGQDIRPLISQNLKWPNALYFDHESDLLWVADGGTLEIMSITAEGLFQFNWKQNEKGLTKTKLYKAINLCYCCKKIFSRILKIIEKYAVEFLNKKLWYFFNKEFLTNCDILVQQITLKIYSKRFALSKILSTIIRKISV